MSNQIWLGIDIAKNSFHAGLADAAAQPSQWAQLPNASFAHSRKGIQSLRSWLKDNGCLPEDLDGVCLEATGRYSIQWCDFVAERLGPISIVNPARPVAYRKSLGIRDKSDRVDSCVLALYGQTIRPKPTSSRSKSRRALCELSRAYHTIDADRKAYQQRLDDKPSCVEVRRALKGVITALKRKRDTLQEKIQQNIDADTVLKNDHQRAQTIPGIGPKTANIILAEFGDLRAYKRNELVALTGLYPREYTSGESVRKSPRMAKVGRESVRAHLYMAAMNSVRYDSTMKAFANRLLANGKEPMQMLGAVMRKLLLLVRTVIVNKVDYDPNYLNTLPLNTD